MKVKTYFERINAGEPVLNIYKELNVHKTTIPSKLRTLGYEYDKYQKQYNWAGDGPEPLDFDLMFDSIGKYKKMKNIQNEVEKKVTPKVKPDVTPKMKHDVTPKVKPDVVPKKVIEKSVAEPQAMWVKQFTDQEVEIIKDMMKSFKNIPQEGDPTLEELATKLPHKKRQRKPVFMFSEIIEWFKKKEKETGVKMGDLYNIALMEFMENWK